MGIPELDIESLGVVGWGLEVAGNSSAITHSFHPRAELVVAHLAGAGAPEHPCGSHVCHVCLSVRL